MQSYAVIIRTAGQGSAYTLAYQLGLPADWDDLATGVAADERIIEAALGGEVILVGPLEEAEELQVCRFEVSVDGYVRELP